VAIGDNVPGWSLHLRGGETTNEGEIVVVSKFLSLGDWRDEGRTRAAFRQVELGASGVQPSYFRGDRAVRRGSRVYCLDLLYLLLKIL